MHRRNFLKTKCLPYKVTAKRTVIITYCFPREGISRVFIILYCLLNQNNALLISDFRYELYRRQTGDGRKF